MSDKDWFFWLCYWVGKNGERNLVDKFNSFDYSLEGLKSRYDRMHKETRHPHFSHYEIYRHGDGKDAPPVYRTGKK